jgi:uncharacterized protein YihD (DUF1040 family)
MTFRMMLVVVGASALLTGYAIAETAQQTKMKTCNADATAKGLKGDARKDFMKICLSAGGEAAAAKPANTQQAKMKSCNADATAKGLKGDARKTFMQTSLSGGK